MKDPYLLHIFNPTKNVSPFDVNMAYEAEFDGVIPYANVTLEEIHSLTQDTIFSRGPKGVKRTGIFIGGRDFGLAIDMLRRAQGAMVPPFEVSVFADPSGAITTAAALVACIEHWAIKQTASGLENKKIYIFGGTGPVGICAGILASNCGGDVFLVSHRGDHIAKDIAAECNARFGSSLHGAANTSNDETTELIASADIIVGAAKAGVRIASKKQLSLGKNLLIAADVNAVPPSGFEGVAADDYGSEIDGLENKALAIGALAIGDVKYKVHTRIFELMMSSKEAKYYEHNEAFKIAREIVQD